EFDVYLVNAEEATNTEMRTLFPKIAIEAHTLTSDLYMDLASYVQGKEVDVTDSVSSFFDKLFPMVYVHYVNTRQVGMPEDYRECLMQSQQEIKPFGEIPHRLALHLQKSLQAARVFIQALNLGIEVINTTDHIVLTRECSKALLKLKYCSSCNGLTMIKPCNSFCRNVMKGCLANVADIDPFWSDYITALDELTEGMRGVYDIQYVVQDMHSKIGDAIMHAMDYGPRISTEVVTSCGSPPRLKRSTINELYEAQDFSREYPLQSEPSTLYDRIRSVIRSLISSKDFYNTLADGICEKDNFAFLVDYNCWNGEDKGSYSKSVVDNGLSAQYTNPEMRVSRQRDQVIAKITDKLLHIQQLLKGKSAAPGEELYISGSGDGKDLPDVGSGCDDEDCEGSGESGDGAIETRLTDKTDAPVRVLVTTETAEDFSFEETTTIGSSIIPKLGGTGKKGETVDNPSSASHLSKSTLATLTVIIVTVFLNRR
ncbi:glypican-5-like, partial [Saccoglossus kowalevskii]|uniref:Glypican-5-like n=1 Tax=Saccoglossus kowalevskii TaxID=10224 RepID=A0ABM0MVA3_SACKO